MTKSLRAIALLLSLTLATAHAETQEALLQRTFDALKQSANALERGDTESATALLGGIKTAAQTLLATAEHYGRQAAESEKQREEEARAVIEQVTQTFRAEEAAGSQVRELTASVADLNAQLQAANQLRSMLETHAALYRQEVRMRQECRAQPLEGFFYSGECWRLSFADVFENRWIHLNNAIAGNNTQRNNIESALRDLNRQLASQQNLLRETGARKAQLESQRQALHRQAGVLRAAVVSLGDASLFWMDTVTVIGSRIDSIEMLQQNVRLLMRRASRESPAPVFDSYDKEEVRSLEATLLDFARTLDNQTNILLRT
jgi:hypothetical protein